MSAEKLPIEILQAKKLVPSGGHPANQFAAANSLVVDYCSLLSSLDGVAPMANP
jgi:hypothetical protein